MSDHPIVCATCKVPVETVPDPQPKDKVSCPQCGHSDTFENVMGMLGDQAVERASRELDKTFRGMKGVKFTPSVKPQCTHRFVMQY